MNNYDESRKNKTQGMTPEMAALFLANNNSTMNVMNTMGTVATPILPGILSMNDEDERRGE